MPSHHVVHGDLVLTVLNLLAELRVDVRERMPSVGGLRSGRAHSLGVGLALESGEVAQEREGVFISLLCLSLHTDRHLLQ